MAEEAKEPAVENKEETPAAVKAEKKPAAAPKPPAVKAEIPKNCAQCGKPMRKIRRYYRNGKYYCNKNCFKNAAAGVKPGEQKAEKTEKK